MYTPHTPLYVLKKQILRTIVFFLLGISNIVIRIIKFKHIANLISNEKGVPTHTCHNIVLSPKQKSLVCVLRQEIFSVSRYTPWRSKCFEQMLTAHALLRLMGISHCVYFGVNKNFRELNAHTWLTVNNIIVTGFNASMDFTSVQEFTFLFRGDQ